MYVQAMGGKGAHLLWAFPKSVYASWRSAICHLLFQTVIILTALLQRPINRSPNGDRGSFFICILTLIKLFRDHRRMLS